MVWLKDPKTPGHRIQASMLKKMTSWTGDIEDFDTAALTSIESTIATQLNIDSSQVTVTVQAGSVVCKYACV